MAELYENPKQYLSAGGSAGSTPTGEPSFEDMLAGLPPEEREEAMQYITAPPSGEEIMKAMQQKNSQGEVMNMSLDQYRLFKAHNKTKEVDVIAGIGEAASTVFEEIQKAAGSVVDNPVDAFKKLTPSVIEAFAQGTRSMYGMAAQSADPNSIFFRMKNALQANGDDEEAEYQQFMEAQAFNVHSMRLMTGQDTIIMDKDVINPEMTQVMSYIADPTLFVPFGGLAAKGATMIGMGEKLAMAAARTQGIRNLVLGGAIKWGVGAPLEFMGGAIRNTIDYGIDAGSRVFETATGVAAKDIQTTAKLSGWGTASASVAGFEVNGSVASLSKLYAGSSIARNVGEAAMIYGDQMMKQGKTGRGVLGYAGQAIRDTERAGIKLTPQTKSLLKAIEAVDPLFVYADDIASGAAQGAIIGGGLGYLAGGEEGFAGGVGSGMALGAVGATAGKIVSDVTGNTKIDQMAIQRKLIIEALKENGNENAVGFEAMAAMAEATGDRAFQGYIDGIIAGIDTVNPDAVFKAFNKVQYETHLKSKGIDPNTGVLFEKSRIFPELNDRTVKADVLGILRDTGGNFAGDPAGFEQAVKSNPAYAKVKPIWDRLDDNAKQVILKQIKDNGDPAFTKSLKGRQLNAHWSDMAYAEKATEIVNTLNQKNANSVPAKVADLLKAETRSDKKLTRRGQMLKEKLQADGYIDKDGKIRTSRLKDVEGTQGEFEASAGWAKSRDSTGRTEVVINLDKWAMDSGNRLSLAHELYHSIMLDSVFAPDYIDRLSQKLLGKFDPKTGRVLEQALVQPDELMKFFGKYIENDPNNRGDAETIKRKKEELKKSIEDYRTRGTANRVADATAIPLEHLVEEFGAYYFSKWVKAQPIDYMFRGGEFGGIRGLMEMASDGWLDYWKGKVNEKNPQFNFDGMGVSSVSKAFEKDGKRVSSRSLDLFMRDIVRIEANRNSNNGFDVNKLSKESREWFLKVNGLRGAAFGQLDQQGNVKKPKLRRYTAEEIRQGKEMFKVLESLPDTAHKDGMRRDGDGNWSGQPNTAQINALVGAGYIQRAWFDRMTRAYDIVNGNGSNVVEFGYLGYSAHIGDGNERVYGAAVPFKNRRAVLIGVDFKVRADGTVFSNLHTLDLKVIEARGNEVWKDPQTRELWKGNRTDMEADFYAYLSNASLPSDHKNRKPSARILDKGDGLGGQRRDALHQMLGFHKGSDLPYINRPIAEIPVGIRHSVTTFSNDGIVNMRVDNKPRYDFNFENAHLDLSRNFMPDEMRQETTPSGGKIIKHATGYNISKQAGTKFKVFDPEGKHLGDFDTVADAGRAAQKHFNEGYDKSVEGKDPAVPRTEVPPSRVEYKDKRVQKILDDNKIEQAVIEALEKEISGITSKENYPESAANYYARPFRDAIEAIKRDGLIKAVSNEDASHVKILQLQQIKPDVSSLGDIDIGIPHYAKELKVSYLLDKLTKLAQHEYDSMYPMEIKSALHGTLAQIFQDYPQITAKGLIGKIQKYGSLNKARLMQEATEIGLIDLLKSKPMATKIKKDIYRAYDPFQQDFTGEVKVKETSVQYEPFVDIQEILDFAKSKEIKVTIEEGARERIGLDTSRYTLGGAKDNYKETAVRINPEYAHGISGHYGKDTIVHFRTTERINADGTRHLFIEEVQANNPDIKSGLSQQEIKDIEIDRDVHLPIYKEILAEGKKQGRYVSDEADGYTSQKEGVIEYVSGNLWSNGYADEITEGMATDWSLLLNNIGSDRNAEWWIRNTVPTALKQLYHEIERGLRTEQYKNPTEHFAQVLMNEIRVDKKGQHKADYIQFCKDISETAEVQKLIDLVSNDAVLEEKWKKYLYDVDQVKNQGYVTYQTYADRPDRLLERISDVETSVQQLNQQKTAKPLPLTAAKDWTLTALKGIIRQAIRDGLDKITLTHPDDSPTTSHMAGDSRKALYGKLIPEVWGSWLKKYGIEIKQSNSMADSTLAQAKNRVAEVSNKIHDANKKVLERFEQVGSSENPEVINALAKILSTPVHEYDGELMNHSSLAGKINDVQLQEGIREVLLLKQTELNNYNDVLRLQEESVAKQNGISSTAQSSDSAVNARISAEAIDRGYTFELNDRIKREFLEGRINTHSMPAEGGADSVKTKNKIILDANGLLSKLGMNLKDKTKMEIWMRHLTDDPATALEFIKEEGLIGWMKNRAQSVIDAEIESWDAGYKELKHQQKVAQQFLDKVESEKIDKPKFQPAEEDAYQGGRTYDFNSKQFKAGFLGLYAEQNPDRVKGVSLQFMKRADGSHRIRLTDNSKKGESADIGHITANIDGDVATLSTHINEDYRGRKLAYVVYSEMAERLRAMGVTAVDGTIVNPDGVPIKVRERIIGDTRDLYSGRRINYIEGANRIRDKQEMVGSAGGIDVTNTLYKQARYQPSESWEASRELGMKSTWDSLPEASRKLFELNIKKFGLTNSAYEAGYILPDARMLDFSGRHESSGFKRVNGKNIPTTKFDEFKDYRGTDHREAVMLPEVKKKMQEEYNWEEDKIGKMQQAGAIRIDHSNYGRDDGRTYLDIGSIPTNKQYEAILDIIKNSVQNKEKHTIGVDIRVNGRAINHPLHDMSVENPEKVILALKREVNKAFKQEGNKPKFQPAEGEQGEPIRLSGKKKTISTKKVSTNEYEMGEGNRTYNTDSRQWTNGFIGRYAEENPILTKGIKLSMKNWDKRTDDYGRRSIELKEGNKLIGRIDYEVKRGSGGKWLLSDPTVRVWEQYRGKGYSNLLYSEMAERARFLGAEDFLQRIENDQALPMFSQVKTFGFGESKLIDADRGQYFPPTKENFDKLKKPLIHIQKQDGNVETMEGYEPWVHSWSKIFSDRHYMPSEGTNAPVNKENRNFILNNIKANANSLRAFEEGQKNPEERSQNYITLDNINPELLRGEAVVMHSPDNAGVEPVQIGRFTVHPRGGMRYPSENPTQGWAGVKAGLGKQINDNGDYNADKGYGWASAVGLIKGENSKMKGTHIGLEVFLRNLQNFTDNNILTERQTIQILKNGLGDIGDTKRPLDTIVEGILADSSKHEGKYTIDGRRQAIEKMTKTDGSASLWKYLQSNLTSIEPHIKGFSSEGVTNANQFIKAILEPMYEAVSDPLTRHAKVGEVYGYLVFRSPVEEPKSNIHPSYKYSVQPVKGGSPVQLDILSTPMDARKAFKNRITAGEVSPLPESEAGFKVSTGQKHIPTMRGTFKPAEFTEFKSEQSTTGRILRNAKGYVIMLANNKFRVYNPTKAIIGVYGSEEEAKKRIYREIPKQ